MSEILTKVTAEVLDRIAADREEIAELCLLLGNTYGPFGQEAETARAVHEWYQGNGIPSRMVSITDARANVVARLEGSGRGRSMLFNAHLDTEASGPDFANLMAAKDPNLIGAWREKDQLFGQTVLNDRGCMALFMVAAKALHDAGVPLAGDVLFTSVAGETGAAPVDEYQGIAYEGKGFGSSYLVRHGVRADYALVAETTGFGSCWVSLGCAYFKVTIRGKNMYTPRLVRPATGALGDHPNAIVKAAAVAEAIEEWAIGFEESRSRPGPCGEIRPKSQVGAIRGGIPWRPNRSATYCALYVDVRLLPGEDVREVHAALRECVAAVLPEAEVELIMAKPGAAAEGIEPLRDAVAESYEQVRGAPQPPRVDIAVASMWRDTNIFNANGMPSLTFGPSRGQAVAQGSGCFELDDLVDGAKIYALTALRLCADGDALSISAPAFRSLLSPLAWAVTGG